MAKHYKKKEPSEKLSFILAPSLICVFGCIICLCGMSWAWFTVVQSSHAEKVVSASFGVDVKAETSDNEFAGILGADGIYHLNSLSIDTEYQIIISENKDSTAKKGYCIVRIGGTTLYTKVISKDSPVVFKYIPKTTDELTIEPVWGDYSLYETTVAGESIIGDRIGEAPSAVRQTPATRPTTQTTTAAETQPATTAAETQPATTAAATQPNTHRYAKIDGFRV